MHLCIFQSCDVVRHFPCLAFFFAPILADIDTAAIKPKSNYVCSPILSFKIITQKQLAEDYNGLG